jgi:hypothetical protein
MEFTKEQVEKSMRGGKREGNKVLNYKPKIEKRLIGFLDQSEYLESSPNITFDDNVSCYHTKKGFGIILIEKKYKYLLISRPILKSEEYKDFVNKLEKIAKGEKIN